MTAAVTVNIPFMKSSLVGSRWAGCFLCFRQTGFRSLSGSTSSGWNLDVAQRLSDF